MPDDLHVKLGLRIRALRTHAGLTQHQLAERVGYGASYFSQIECGARGVTLDTLAAVSGILGVTLSELFLEVDRPFPRDFDRLSTALAGQSPARQRILLRILEDALRLAAAPPGAESSAD